MMINKNINMFGDFTIANENCSNIDNIWRFFLISFCSNIHFLRQRTFVFRKGFHKRYVVTRWTLFFNFFTLNVSALLILRLWTKTLSRIENSHWITKWRWTFFFIYTYVHVLHYIYTTCREKISKRHA